MLSLILGWLGLTIVLVTGLGYASSVVRRPPPAQGDSELAAELDRLCSRRTRRLAAGVVDLGDEKPTRSAFVRADESTRFEIGSVTKALTGMLLACALDRGEVTLDTEVGEVVAEVRDTPLGGVALEALCTHTSGLPRLALTVKTAPRLLLLGGVGVNPYRRTSTTGLLSTAVRQRRRGRGVYRYSNLGAAVLGQVLARAARRDFADLLVDRVLDPCGMQAAGVSMTGRTARWGWSSLGMFWMTDTVPGTKRQMVWHNGATGGYSTFLALFPQARRAVVVVADASRPKDTERVATGLARWLASHPRDD